MGALVKTDTVSVMIVQSPSYSMFRVSDAGDVIGRRGRPLRHFPDKDGYRRVNAYYADTKTWRQIGVHILVCEAFHGPRPNGAHVGHNDGDRANNRANNLRWTTAWQNEHDKRRHGTAMLGGRNHRAKLTDDQVRVIRQRRADGDKGVDLAREYGVTASAIASIGTRKTWAHLL